MPPALDSEDVLIATRYILYVFHNSDGLPASGILSKSGDYGCPLRQFPDSHFGLKSPMGLTKVYLEGVTTSAQAVAPTLPLGMAKGNATMNSAVPNTVAARLAGLAISTSMIISIPSS